MQPLANTSGFSQTVKTLVVANTHMYNATIQQTPVRDRINAALAILNSLESIRGGF